MIKPSNILSFEKALEKSERFRGRCEFCNKVILIGEQYLDATTVFFCKDHAMYLSDVVEQHQTFHDEKELLEFYDSLSEQKIMLDKLKEDLEKNGDRRFTHS